MWPLTLLSRFFHAHDTLLTGYQVSFFRWYPLVIVTSSFTFNGNPFHSCWQIQIQDTETYQYVKVSQSRIIYSQGPIAIWTCLLTSKRNPIVEIRRSYDCLISTIWFPLLVRWHLSIDGLVQERCNSIANALELHLSCTKPLILGPGPIITWYLKILQFF